jgi:hypothetical protein
MMVPPVMASAWAAVSGARSAIAASLCVAGLCLPLGYCTGFKSASSRCSAERALASTKALEIDAHARDAADQARFADVIAISTHEQDLVDAISTVPDSAPDRVRVALGCQRLRAQGTVEADLPAVCRP